MGTGEGGGGKKEKLISRGEYCLELERGGQVSLKHLKVLEQRCRLNYSEMGNQLIFSKCFTPM